MSVVDLSIRSMMCTPLLINGEILGLVQVDTCTTPRGFTAEDLQVLTGISAQAAIAVKNLQLYEAIEAETARRISLQRYFSPGLVDMLMSGEVTATLGGDAYQGTILLADIIGFTAMSEKMPPARVVAKLNRYFTIMQKVIYDHGGNVDKFNGDGLMAFWGVPRPGAHDESDAVLTAICMQQKLWPFNLQLCAEGQQPVHMGIAYPTNATLDKDTGFQGYEPAGVLTRQPKKTQRPGVECSGQVPQSSHLQRTRGRRKRDCRGETVPHCQRCLTSDHRGPF